MNFLSSFFQLKHLDWKLNLAVFFLIAAGLTSLLSAEPSLFYKQLNWFIAGLILMLSFDYFWRNIKTPKSDYVGA